MTPAGMWIPPSVARMLSVVGGAYGVSVADIRGKSQMAKITPARHLVCYLLVRHAGYSLPHAGRFIFRHHTTVLHSVRVVERALADVPAWIAIVKEIANTASVKRAPHSRSYWQPPELPVKPQRDLVPLVLAPISSCDA